NVNAGISKKVYVPDHIFGIDPLITRASFVPRAYIAGSGTYRLWARNAHALRVGYGLSSLLHFSTNAFPYDHVVHGPRVGFDTKRTFRGSPLTIKAETQFLDGFTNLSRPEHFLYGNATRISTQVH